MANALYDKGREGFLDGSIDWDTNNIKAVLVRGYTPSLTTHTVLDSVTGAGGTLVSTTTNFTTKTVTGGVADADNIVFSAVASGSSCAHVVIYADSGSSATSRLIALLDTTTTVTLPVTPNGGDINITWSNGADKIFKL